MISVPAGVRTPVVAKAGLTDDGKTLIKDHAVYVRSLTSNHRVSSSEVRRGDWERLMRICFDNREADIGAFVRRHLAGLDFQKLAALFGGTVQAVPTLIERVGEILNIGRARFDAVVNERNIKLPALGYREAAVLVDGKCHPIRQLNPSYSGSMSLCRNTLAGLLGPTLVGPRRS